MAFALSMLTWNGTEKYISLPQNSALDSKGKAFIKASAVFRFSSKWISHIAIFQLQM
jgi:hypothetical protein